MPDLPKITDLNVEGKRVLVRADLDVGETLEKGDDSKLLTNQKTIEYLVQNKAKIILASHRGRPEGRVSQALSLDAVAVRLSELLNRKIEFIYDTTGGEAREKSQRLLVGSILMLENLRFDLGEEENNENFSKSLASFADIYINEAFSSSAKAHASISGIPKLLPHAFGFHFLDEIENLSKVLNDPKRPVVVLISGVKEDKLDYIEPFSRFADKILIAGRLPEIIDPRDTGKSELDSNFRNKILQLINGQKVIVADLIQDKEDITLHSIERFEQEISLAGTVVVGGPVGKYEDKGHRQGTQKVFEAVSKNKNAFKVAGGGDTEQAIATLGLTGGFNWISVGGGASLDYLATGTLPGIKAME